MRKIPIEILLVFILISGGFFYHQIFTKENLSFQIDSYQKETSGFLKETSSSSPKKGVISRKIEQIISQVESFLKKTQKRIEEEKRKNLAENVKGIYINEYVANSRSQAAIQIREEIKKLLFESELNGVVIDIKEVSGPKLLPTLKEFINELKEKNIWVIARICVFRDNSQIKEKPYLYLKSKTGSPWKDNGGNYWLDPANPEVWQYIINFSKIAIDFGFDELQFDYIRFPSDGNLEDIVYFFNGEDKEKWQVLQEFMGELTQDLKSYRPEIFLSIDLFGLVALEHKVPAIGQRLEDAAKFFDFISPMLYPSHFYGGFFVQKDTKRSLPALYFPYEGEDVSQVVSNHPFEVIYRSVLSALDFISALGLKAKIRPWLQDFSLKRDTERGIFYDAGKVKIQIEAAEAAGASGFLLWNPANIYTKEIFLK